MNPRVRSVSAQPDYVLALEFDNGERRVCDATRWLDRGDFRALRDPARFVECSVQGGAVAWPGGLDLSWDTLYLRSEPVDAE